MKKPLVSLIVLVALTACKDNTSQILSTIDGRWQVNSVKYVNRAGTDSAATAANASLLFDACQKKANNSSPGNCTMTYQEGNQAYSFTYQAGDKSQFDKSKAVTITSTGQQTSPVNTLKAELIAGGYDIVTLTDNTLLLRKSFYSRNIPGTFIQISATK